MFGACAPYEHLAQIVWNYQTPKARPIAYGVGEFRSFEVDGSHTRVTWTYSFKLKEDVFPGNLGGLGRFLFRVGFLDRDYAAMMRGVLDGYKATAEQLERHEERGHLHTQHDPEHFQSEIDERNPGFRAAIEAAKNASF